MYIYIYIIYIYIIPAGFRPQGALERETYRKHLVLGSRNGIYISYIYIYRESDIHRERERERERLCPI